MYKKNDKKAFTLIEVIGIMAVISILATLSLFPIMTLIDSARVATERQKLKVLATEIRSSFQQTDMHRNISALPSDLPLDLGGICPAPTISSMLTYFERSWYATDASGPLGTNQFDRAYYDGSESSPANAWYTKIAKIRGQTDITIAGSVSLKHDARGPIREIVFNTYNSRRILIVGPTENNVQRYLLLSFMFRNRPGLDLAIEAPAANYAVWFNDLYNYNWGQNDGHPAAFTGSSWDKQTTGGKTYAQRVMVERIVQRRYVVNVNNTTEDAMVCMFTNFPCPLSGDQVYPLMTGMTGFSGFYKRNDGAGGSSSENTYSLGYGILEGRKVEAWSAAKEDTETVNWDLRHTLMYSFQINENTTVTAQDSL